MTPTDVGLDPVRYDRAVALLQKWADTDTVPAAGLCVGRKGKVLPPVLVGRQRPGKDGPPIRQDALFLIASPTKPIAVGAVLMLVERGELALEDSVARFVPRFAENGKANIQIRHLMTHTSGLPDMLPENEQLRREHKPLSAFIDGICRLSPLFPAGTRVSYQSMGTAMLAEVLHQITGTTLADFLRKEVFLPLGMKDTSLGWDPAKKDRIAAVRLPPGADKTDWHWNSPYWLGFGAPWGGLITSPADFGRYLQMLLNGGQFNGVRIFSPATVRAMTTNQLASMPAVPEEDRRCKPWGLGWRLNWPAYSSNFGDLLGPRTFGHWGATGTVVWADPDLEAFCVVFTTQPQEPEGRFLARLSNAVAAAFV